MDHSCDSVNSLSLAFLFCQGFELGGTWMYFVLQTMGLVCFYVSQWEESKTHVCRTSSLSWWGVTETQLATILLVIANAAFGFYPSQMTFGSSSVRVINLLMVWCLYLLFKTFWVSV